MFTEDRPWKMKLPVCDSAKCLYQLHLSAFFRDNILPASTRGEHPLVDARRARGGSNPSFLQLVRNLRIARLPSQTHSLSTAALDVRIPHVYRRTLHRHSAECRLT